MQNAVATAVLPEMLARGFRRVREYAAEATEYRDGSRQTRLLVASSRKMWTLELRLAPAAMTELREFFEARPHKAFLFYDAEERRAEGATPLYDETGAAGGPGKYTVRFDAAGGWRQVMDLARGNTGVRLVEIS